MSSGDGVSKRTFLKLAVVINGLVGSLLSIPVVRYLLSPATKRPRGADAWISLGPMSRFPMGETRLASFANPVMRPSDGVTANIACWVRHIEAETFQVFAINCAHLGCPVRWFPQSNLFMCPCHGGAYYADGSRASGPPERGLFEYPYRIERDEVWIRAEELPTPGLAFSADGKRRLRCV
jgi:menaquinol-cytochrome c reductase iron-sulfur subunit